jgi:fatty-acyl-CoA synthase
MDLSVLLDMATEGMPGRVAVTAGATGLTYAELHERAGRAAAWLLARGVDRVALLDENSEIVPTLLFGAAIAAIPFAPLNYRLADDRLEAIAARLGRAVLIVADDAAQRIAVPGVDVVTRSDFEEQLAAVAPTAERRASPDDVAVVLFTSGTSGDPKSAILRHRHLVSYIIQTVEFMGSDEDEAALVSVPPYHIAGISAILSSVYGGRRIVYLRAFAPEAWVTSARAERITHAMVVPTMLKRILDAVETDGAGLASVRHLSYGGGRMPLPVIEQALRVLGPDVAFVNAYGLTETSSTVSILGPEDHREAFGSDDPDIARRLGSVGRPVPGIELEIRGGDGGTLAPGLHGEVWVRGDQVSGEYADQSGEDGRGWFHTRDVGWLDDGGFLFLEGRADDVIVRGGENLSPGEIEDVLVQHPDLVEAAVVGLPSVEWGQVPVAVIVATAESGSPPSAEDVRAWVKRHLRSSRVPDEVVFVDELPYTDTGKLLRRVVRDRLMQDRSLA